MGKLTDLLNLAQARTRELGLPYTGALTPKEAYEVWQLAPGSKLVDVRTRAEWDWVGRIPGAEEIEWMSYPENQPNSFFLAQLKQQVDREALVIRTRALDRLLRAGYYQIPTYGKGENWLAYWNMYQQPKVKPKLSTGIEYWWSNAMQAQKVANYLRQQ